VERTPISPVSPSTQMQRWVAQAAAYFELTKPRVVALIVFTAVVGMLLATPGSITPQVFACATLGISLAAGAAATFNHVLDRRADAIMARTRARPLPSSQLSARQASMFGAVLAAVAALTLVFGVNTLTAVLTMLTLVGYSVIYTVILKPLTPQNIVIGGAAGAAPPVLGWTAITGEVTLDAMLLFLIVFIWTPPHFWALALYREKDYASANIPMLPVTHGSAYTRRQILGYTITLAVVCLLPYATGMSGPTYLIGALALNLRFVAYAWQLHASYSDTLARKMFRFSIHYLAALFALLLLDRFLMSYRGELQSFLFGLAH
jgi:protoheme IX farnesyltransferase